MPVPDRELPAGDDLLKHRYRILRRLLAANSEMLEQMADLEAELAHCDPGEPAVVQPVFRLLDGSLLLALQHILNKISSNKVQVDCEFFRKRKESKLRDFAQQVGRYVAGSGKQEILEPMNPYERRIIHMTINQIQGITSESIGEGFLKRVKVFPVPKSTAR